VRCQINSRDLGAFYPWILAALPFGIVLRAFFEPIRLAHGGSTEDYAARGVTVAGGMIGFGNRSAVFLAAGFVLGMIADALALGRQRIGAVVAGLLGGGLSALAFSSIVAWRGDVNVAELFFGSAWNIAWACTAVGAATGAASGWWAGWLREKQQQRHEELFENNASRAPGKSSDQITEST